MLVILKLYFFSNLQQNIKISNNVVTESQRQKRIDYVDGGLEYVIRILFGTAA